MFDTNLLFIKTTFKNMIIAKQYNVLFICKPFLSKTHVHGYTLRKHMITPTRNVYTDTACTHICLAISDTNSLFTKTTFEKHGDCYG